MTFHSTFHALNFEKKLKEKEVNVKLIPVPRKLSSSCGSAGKFNCENKEFILRICREEDIETDNLYELEEEKKQISLLDKIIDKRKVF